MLKSNSGVKFAFNHSKN